MIIHNLKEDARVLFQTELGSSSNQLEELVTAYLNIRAKSITNRPRKVHISREVAEHPLVIYDKKHVLEEIQRRFEAGEEVNRYLTEKRTQLGQWDRSLAVFGTHHLHLGDVIETKGRRAGLIRGTKKLLFIKVFEDSVYFIRILDHGMVNGFLNLELVRTLFRNWPQLLEPYRCVGATGLAINYSDEEVARLLENEINTFVELAPGKVYVLPAGGVTTAGTDVAVQRGVDSFISMLDRVIETLNTCEAQVREAVHKVSGVDLHVLRFEPRLTNEGFLVVETGSKAIITVCDGVLVVSSPVQSEEEVNST